MRRVRGQAVGTPALAVAAGSSDSGNLWAIAYPPTTKCDAKPQTRARVCSDEHGTRESDLAANLEHGGKGEQRALVTE